MVAGDVSFGDDTTVEQQHGDAPVVEVVETVIGVDINQLGLQAEVAEEAESVIAQVAALPGDQEQAHDRSERNLAGQRYAPLGRR